MSISKVVDHVVDYLEAHPNASILDYGAGKHLVVTYTLKKAGHTVKTHDSEENTTHKIGCFAFSKSKI
jgi:hypothetical protein